MSSRVLQETNITLKHHKYHLDETVICSALLCTIIIDEGRPMRSAQITDDRALEALWPVLDEDISAVQEEEDMYAERAEIDRLIQEVQRELAAEKRRETVRIGRGFTDQRRAR